MVKTEEHEPTRLGKIVINAAQQFCIGMAAFLYADIIVPCATLSNWLRGLLAALRTSIMSVLRWFFFCGALYLFGMTLYLFYKYVQNEDPKVHEEISEFKKQLNTVNENGVKLIYIIALELAKQIIIGAVIGSLSFSFKIMLLLAEVYFMPVRNSPPPYYPQPKKGYVHAIGDAEYCYNTTYAPIIEELMFRGILLNVIKAITIATFEGIKYLYKNLIWAWTGKEGSDESITKSIVPESIQKYLPDADTVISWLSVLCTAVIFSREHSPQQHRSAFIGGTVYGALYECYGITASIAAHKANNTWADDPTVTNAINYAFRSIGRNFRYG